MSEHLSLAQYGHGGEHPLLTPVSHLVKQADFGSLLIFPFQLCTWIYIFSILLIQQVLLPGVFALIKGCTPTELAFLQASLEPRVRESFQGIMTKFDRSYKFGGRM